MSRKVFVVEAGLALVLPARPGRYLLTRAR